MRAYLAEVLGTFILVFVGLSAVANAVLLDAYSGLLQVAVIWGLGVTLAIVISGPVSGAHLNPAMTVAFACTTDFPWRRVIGYLLSQCLGSLIASVAVYCVFQDVILGYELTQNITRGGGESLMTAMIFGEYFPNPAMLASNESLSAVSMSSAFITEFLGTLVLAFVVFTVIRRKELPAWLVPILIGATLTVLISLLAPISMAGFNPARDFIPRLFSSCMGWGDLVFSSNGNGWWLVYIFGPLLGALAGAFLSKVYMNRS